MKTKEAKDCAASPKKVWTDRGPELKGAFKKKLVIKGVSTPI